MFRMALIPVGGIALAAMIGCGGGGGPDPKPVPKLVCDLSLTVTPSPLESNDTITFQMGASARMENYSGTSVPVVRTIYLDVDGDGVWDQSWPGNATASVQRSISGLALIVSSTTTFQPVLKAEVDNPLTGQIDSILFKGSYVVNPEKDRYVAGYVDAKSYIISNLDRVSITFASGKIQGTTFTASEWKGWLTTFFDGIDNGSNPEVDRLIFDDLSFNRLFIYRTDGTIVPIDEIFPESDYDALRLGCMAKIP